MKGSNNWSHGKSFKLLMSAGNKDTAVELVKALYQRNREPHWYK